MFEVRDEETIKRETWPRDLFEDDKSEGKRDIEEDEESSWHRSSSLEERWWPLDEKFLRPLEEVVVMSHSLVIGFKGTEFVWWGETSVDTEVCVREECAVFLPWDFLLKPEKEDEDGSCFEGNLLFFVAKPLFVDVWDEDFTRGISFPSCPGWG